MRPIIGKAKAIAAEAVTHYEHSAPTVSTWADSLAQRIDARSDEVRLSELLMLDRLHDGGWMAATAAEYAVFRLQERLKDVTGHAGF